MTDKISVFLKRLCSVEAGTIGLIVVLYAANAVIVRQHAVINCGTTPYENGIPKGIQGYVKALRHFDYPALRQLSRERTYPPFQIITIALVTLVFGKNWTAMIVIINSSYLLLLLVSVYFLGRRMGGQRTGITAVLLLSLYPLVYGAHATCSVDFPLAAVAALSVLLMLKSDSFRHTAWSIACAASCAAGILLKQPFAALIAGPLLLTAVPVLRAPRANRKALRNLFIFSGIVLAGASLYYDGNTIGFLFRVLGNEVRPYQTNFLFFYDLGFFFPGFWKFQLPLPFLLLFAASALVFVKRAPRTPAAFILSWLGISYALLLVVPHEKTARYVLANMPALALVSAVGLEGFAHRRFSGFLFGAMIAFGLLQFYFLTYGPKGSFLYYQHDGLNARQVREWSAVQKSAVDALADYARARSKKEMTVALTAGSYPLLGDNLFDLYFWLNDLPPVRQITFSYDAPPDMEKVDCLVSRSPVAPGAGLLAGTGPEDQGLPVELDPADRRFLSGVADSFQHRDVISMDGNAVTLMYSK